MIILLIIHPAGFKVFLLLFILYTFPTHKTIAICHLNGTTPRREPGRARRLLNRIYWHESSYLSKSGFCFLYVSYNRLSYEPIRAYFLMNFVLDNYQDIVSDAGNVLQWRTSRRLYWKHDWSFTNKPFDPGPTGGAGSGRLRTAPSGRFLQNRACIWNSYGKRKFECDRWISASAWETGTVNQL